MSHEQMVASIKDGGSELQGSRDRIEQTNEVWYGKRDTQYTPLREKDYCSLLPTHANTQVGLQENKLLVV